MVIQHQQLSTSGKPRVPEGCVIHCFRHSMRDRLGEVQADMIDQIGGWIGQAYGEGYNLKALFYNMKDI